MTGSIIIGTHDSANIEIAEEVGEDHIFFFGNQVHYVDRVREELRNGKRGYISGQFKNALMHFIAIDLEILDFS